MSGTPRERLRGGDPSAVPEVIAILGNDPEPAARSGAAIDLGKHGDRRAIPALEAALLDLATVETRFDERSVGQEAADALEALYGRLGVEDDDVQRTVLLWASVPVSHLLVNLLRGFGAAAAEPITRLFPRLDGEHRASAAFLLGECVYAPAFDVLHEGLRRVGGDRRASVACASALGALGRPEALEALLRELRRGAPNADPLVLGAVERCCPRERRLELAIACGSERWNEPDRKRILAVLARLYQRDPVTLGESVWTHLVELYGPVHEATTLTSETWERLAGAGRIFWIRTTRDGHGGGEVSFELARPGTSRTIELGPLESASAYVLSDEFVEIAPWLPLLDRNGWEQITDVPRRGALDPVPVLMRARDGDASCAPELVEILRTHPESGYRFDAARYLGRFGGRDALPFLEHALADGTGLLISHEATAVAQGAIEGLRGIYRRLGPTPEDVERTLSLWSVSSPAHLPALLLRDFGALAGPALVEAFPRLSTGRRVDAAGLLAESQYLPGLDVLRAGLQDAEQAVRHACAAALGRLRDETSLPTLLAMLAAEAPVAWGDLMGGVWGCRAEGRELEIAVVYASRRWNDPAREAWRRLLARLLGDRLGGLAALLWAHLVARHGPVRRVAAMPPEDVARALASARVFWVKTTREGPGIVTFLLAREGAPVALRVVPLETAEAFTFADDALEIETWLDALSVNEWRSVDDVPGLASPDVTRGPPIA
ncbi:MAG: hypothetical protein JST00_00615 [Deltaproteobacteria bacterium]|nr:hypothetical protein [Deltaproteobacteria bacterium]